jgi:hypothetical protein
MYISGGCGFRVLGRRCTGRGRGKGGEREELVRRLALVMPWCESVGYSGWLDRRSFIFCLGGHGWKNMLNAFNFF